MPHQQRRRSILAATALLLSLALPRPAEASRDSLNCGDGCTWLVLGAAFVLGVDVYYTVQAYRGPSQVTEKSGRHELAWTSWQAGLGLYGTFWALSTDTNSLNSATGLLTLDTWPLSLSAHGIWYGFPNNRAAGWTALSTVAAADTTILAFDAYGMATSTPTSTASSVLETLVGGMQTGFGIVTSLRAAKKDRALSWSLTALPLLITAHGITTWIDPTAFAGHTPRTGSHTVAFPKLPHLTVVPTADGALLQMHGWW
jgi:hypothetical protein